MGRADDEIPVGADRRQLTVRKLGHRWVIRVQGIAGRRLGAEVETGQINVEGGIRICGVSAGRWDLRKGIWNDCRGKEYRCGAHNLSNKRLTNSHRILLETFLRLTRRGAVTEPYD